MFATLAGRVSGYDAKVLVKDLSKDNARFLNYFTKRDMMKILTLFDRARKDGRVLRFLTSGPEAYAACEAIHNYLTGPPASPLEAFGFEHWEPGRWRGVRRADSEAEQGIYIDPTPVLLSMVADRGISL